MGNFEEGWENGMGYWACIFFIFQTKWVSSWRSDRWESRYRGILGSSWVSSIKGGISKGQREVNHEESGLLHKREKRITDRLCSQKSSLLSEWFPLIWLVDINNYKDWTFFLLDFFKKVKIVKTLEKLVTFRERWVIKVWKEQQCIFCFLGQN